jgi:hypothetical protein
MIASKHRRVPRAFYRTRNRPAEIPSRVDRHAELVVAPTQARIDAIASPANVAAITSVLLARRRLHLARPAGP